MLLQSKFILEATEKFITVGSGKQMFYLLNISSIYARVTQIWEQMQRLKTFFTQAFFTQAIKKHRHAKRARVIIFLAIGAYIELFTVMIWLHV